MNNQLSKRYRKNPTKLKEIPETGWKAKYYDVQNQPGSYASATTFWQNIRNQQDAPKNRKQLQHDLLSEPAYAIHFPIRKHFTRHRVLVHNIDELWNADLVDLRSLASRNRNYNYILTVIDVS
jgi:hypothetical protein